MTKKRLEKKIPEIELFFDSVLVCNDRKLKPFIEILNQEPENITSQNLGTLFGVFEINDDSEDSSYIVNYLVSIIKKEYFSKPKRGPIESLEAALHKANLALSKLAEHGSVSWLGKLNALVAVTEKNNLHLSQAGTASAFLLRSKLLTDISEGLAPEDPEPYPLKTFVNVSSGRLEKNDKLIVTTDSIFDIFSPEEIKKSSLRFSNEEFVQFLRTALGNELEKSAVLIIDIAEKGEIPEPEPVKNPVKEINVFSQAAFIKNQTKTKTYAGEIEKELTKEIQKSKSDFVDKKTGHIYIKENNDVPLPKKDSRHFEAFSDFFSSSLQRITSSSKNFGQKVTSIKFPKLKSAASGVRNLQANSPKPAAKPQIKPPVALALIRKFLVTGANRLNLTFSRERRTRAFSATKTTAQKTTSLLSNILPKFSRIKDGLLKMSYQQKLYTVLALIVIFIVPLFIIRVQDNMQAKKERLLAEQNQPVIIPLDHDKNVVRVESINRLYSAESAISRIINLNGKIFASTATSIIDVEKNEAFPIPQDFGSPKDLVGMDDLNSVFLLNNDRKIISFSPISEKFQSNNIIIPEDSNISAVGTYLTYIYIVDSKNNQIYRYPRAEGGFGERTNWLKDAVDLSQTASMAMNENIYVADEKSITKLFKGKKQEFSMEESATSIIIKEISLGGQSGNLFILDQSNGRIIHLDAENKIINQYYNPEVKTAKNLTINEEAHMILFSSNNEIKTISIN